jgi:hypothetical protein
VVPAEGTECGVTSSQIIRCGSEACYAANPEKDRPTWPLDGGPHLKKFKVPTDLPWAFGSGKKGAALRRRPRSTPRELFGPPCRLLLCALPSA